MTAKKTKPHVTIDLADVVNAGGVESALLAWAAESDTTSAGTVGPAFSTSGPGNGWSMTHGADDFALRAFEGGALYYLDAEDGRILTMIPGEGESEDDTYRDINGDEFTVGDWSDASVVRLEVPNLDEAIEHPERVAEMVKAVIDHHGPLSDRKGWAELVKGIKEAADALSDIDADELTAE